MITRLPRWIWLGAGALAFVAGMVNVVGLLGFERQAITHLTGTTSMLASAVADTDLRATGHFAALVAAFVAGCAASGFIVQDSVLQLGRRYGVALGLVSALLFASAWLLGRGNAAGLYTAACAMGLQNAMVTTFSGAVVRTTHLSGMFTDLGIFIGHAVRGLPVDGRRLRLCATVIGGFLGGGIAGAVGFRWLGFAALLVPAGLTAAVALAYAGYRVRRVG